MKKLLCAVLAIAMMLTACLAMAETVEEVIAQAQTMTNEELYAKAIEESNGKTLYGIGNSSRGKTAGASFIEMLQKIDPNYTGTIEWSQPKNNSIFTTLNADIKSANHIYSMTLIQDGNQIQTKMLDTGNLLNFIPKEWAEGEGVIVEGNDKPLALQTLNKVFMYNTVGDKTFTNCWDFVAEGVAPLFMGVNSELVGKNFLYMLTKDTYADYLKDAFDAMPDGAAKDRIAAEVEEMKPEAEALMLDAENAPYALAYIKLFCEQYNEQTDDGPICNTLVTKSAADQCGLLVYSKLRSVEESAETSVNNIAVADNGNIKAFPVTGSQLLKRFYTIFHPNGGVWSIRFGERAYGALFHGLRDEPVTVEYFTPHGDIQSPRSQGARIDGKIVYNAFRIGIDQPAAGYGCSFGKSKQAH